MFTHEYRTLNNFTLKWRSALTEVMRYYPEGRLEIVKESPVGSDTTLRDSP